MNEADKQAFSRVYTQWKSSDDMESPYEHFWKAALAHRDAPPAVAVNEHELCPSCRNSDIYACTCPFPSARNHTPDTGKMVRLTDDSLISIYLACKAEWKTTNKRQRQRIALIFGNAIMDAMIKKNGGAHATD